MPWRSEMDKIDYFYSETNKHIRNVQLLMNETIRLLLIRARLHDISKFDDAERELFIKFSPKLSEVQYGSKEYKAMLAQLRPALEHHNQHNHHHPEYFARGINGMSLIDLLEMLCDWIAASKRSPDGDVIKSIELNQERFGYSDELKNFLLNTARCFSKQEAILETHAREDIK